MDDELKELVARYVFPHDLPFEFNQRDSCTYDAVFPCAELPSFNFDGLKRRLSARAGFKPSADESGFEAAVFEGQYNGQRVLLYLRSEATAAQGP